MKNSYCKSFDRPDETSEFKAHGHVDVLNFDDETTIGRGVFEPGWKWSSDVKPIAGTDSCQHSHNGYCLTGSMHVQMDSGEQFSIHSGDAFHIPPGHDAWVEGDKSCVLIDATGMKSYADKEQAARKAA